MASKSKHAFGSEANVSRALSDGTIDAYDILFLDEGKIGWIDKNGNPVFVENGQVDQAVLDEKISERVQETVNESFGDSVQTIVEEKISEMSQEGVLGDIEVVEF